jgi:predicted RNA-binding Zn-ribbon protein involved in translation (DUF1610 family)
LKGETVTEVVPTYKELFIGGYRVKWMGSTRGKDVWAWCRSCSFNGLLFVILEPVPDYRCPRCGKILRRKLSKS